MKEKIKVLTEKIRGAKTIAMLGHKNPDGDSMCSMLALARLIEINFGVRPLCVYDGNIPDGLENIPRRPMAKYVGHADISGVFDLVFVLDYGTPKHFGDCAPLVENARYTIEIDHHQNDAPVADLCIDDTSASATGEIIYEVMRAAKWKYDADVLDLLAIAILTDTGKFKYIDRARPLQIMADLVDEGVNIRRLIDSISGKPRKTIQAEAAVVSRAEFLFHGRVALATVETREYRQLDGRGDIVLGLLAQVKGVEYVIMLKRQKENQTGVSLRSQGRPVNHIAAALGGGGHVCAAGAVVADSLENVRAQILELLKGEKI